MKSRKPLVLEVPDGDAATITAWVTEGRETPFTQFTIGNQPPSESVAPELEIRLPRGAMVLLQTCSNGDPCSDGHAKVKVDSVKLSHQPGVLAVSFGDGPVVQYPAESHCAVVLSVNRR